MESITTDRSIYITHYLPKQIEEGSVSPSQRKRNSRGLRAREVPEETDSRDSQGPARRRFQVYNERSQGPGISAESVLNPSPRRLTVHGGRLKAESVLKGWFIGEQGAGSNTRQCLRITEAPLGAPV